MKPIALCITDTHLDDGNEDLVYNIFEQAIKVAKENDLDTIYHLGDHFTSRIAQRLKTLIAFHKILKLLEREGITLITIAGNHDKTDQSSEVSYLDVFKSSKLDVFKGNTVGVRIDKDTKVYLLPFFTDDVYDEKLLKINETLNPSERNILLTHIGIDGVLNNDGLSFDSTIKVGKFQKFDLVLIGHYHNYNKVSRKIQYMGSTDPRNFGEDSNKGCILINPDLSQTRVKFSFKEYTTVTISNFTEKDIDEFVDQYKDSLDNVRFKFEGNDLDLLKVDKKKIKSLGIDVITVNTEAIQAEQEEVIISPINMTKGDLLKSLKNYCKDQGIDSKKSSRVLKYFV